MYRLFVERFNISPQRFLVKTRMEAARDLLQKCNLSVTETASAVGYASVFVFSKTFSNYFGISPSSYKK
jgi:transcriptional regulator GlxA family with amidase domain